MNLLTKALMTARQQISKTDYLLLPPPERDVPLLPELDLDAEGALVWLVEGFAEVEDPFDCLVDGDTEGPVEGRVDALFLL